MFWQSSLCGLLGMVLPPRALWYALSDHIVTEIRVTLHVVYCPRLEFVVLRYIYIQMFTLKA